MLVNGFGYSEKKPIKLNLNFNFNELELALETPFDPVKTFQIRGKLVTSVNMYNINATGVWNSDRVEYYGNMKTDQNFSIHSQLKIGELSHGLLHFDLIKLETTKKIYLICEYPSDKNNYQLLGNLETESDNINFNFEAKTPFQSISRFLVHATGSSNTVQFEAIADSFNQSAGILFDALCSKPLQFYSNLKTNLPHINTVLRLTTKVDNNTYGYVQVEDVIKNKNFSITYEKLDSRRFLRCKIEKKIYELEMDLINALNKLEIVYSEILENVNEVRANAKIGIFNNSLIDSEISVRGMTQFFIKILVSETIDKIYFCLNDSVLFYLDQTKSPKLQIKISNLINASVSSNGSSFDLNVNSDMPKFKNASIQTAWSLNSQRRMLSINFENIGTIKNGKTIVSVQNQEYKFVTLLFNDSAAFLNVSAEVVLDSNIRGTVYAAIYDLEHFANCTIKRHGLNDFSIVSSFLPYNVVTLQLSNTISAPSFLLFFGEDSPNFLKRSFGHSYILLQYWSNENQFFFKFDAPNNLQYSFLKIYGKLRIDNTSVIFSNNLEVKSAITKNLNLRTEAHLTANDAKLSIYYTLPFTGIHSELDFDFHIPFSFSNNFVPKVCIHLPKSNFSLHCIVKYAPNEFCISGGHEFSSERSNLLLHVVNDDTKVLPIINFNYTVPYVSNTPVKFALEQKENVINSHLSILDWQAQSFLIFKTNHYLNITLFSLTKKISAEIQYQNAPNIFVSALLSHPHYPKKLGISFDAFCRDFKKVHINGMVAIPTVLTTEFALQNNLYYSSEFKQYGLISAVKINDFNLDLSINSSIEENFLHFMINTEVDSFRFLINFNYDECALDKINFLCEVQTPMPPFTDFRASLVVPKNLINGINTSLSYNKKPIVHLDLHTIPNNFSINFYNVLLPLSIECKYLKSGVFELSGNICWDFNSSSNSQLGGHIYLGNNISIGFVTPSRVMAFDTRTFKNLQNTYYFGRLSWFKNEEISVSLSFTNNTLKSKIFETHHIVVSFPFRTFEITTNWKLIYHTSNIRLNYEAMPGKTFTKLFVPIWEHEIILNVHQSMSNMPMYVKTELMYSNDTNKHITFEVFNNEDIFKTEKMIILQHPSSKINYTIRLLTNRLPHASYGNISLSYTNYMLKRQEEIRGFLKISHERFEVYGEIETTKNYVSILSALTSGPHYQRLLNILQLNQKDPFVVEGVYNFKETGPSVSLVSSYGKERRYDLYGGFPSKREFTIKLSRTIYDEQMIEGHFNIKLNTSQMLSVKLLWKKDILWEYYNMIFNEYSDTKYIIESIGREIIDVIEDDVGQELIIDFQNIRDNINLYINEEIRLLSNDYLNFLNDLEDGYQSNSFYYKYIQETIETIFPQFSYLRDILVEPFWDFFQEVFDQLTLALQDIYSAVYDIYHLIQQQIEFAVNRLMQIKKFKEDAKRILRTVIDDVRLFLHRLENVFIELIDDIDQNVTSIKQQCLNFLRPYLNRLEDFIAYVEQRLAILQMLVLDILDTIQNYVVNLRESKELIKMYVIYINWLEEFHISQILEPIADVLEQALATVINDFKKITEDYNPYLEAIFGRYEAINEVPALVEFRKTISTFSHRILWIWNHHNLTDLMKNQVHQYVSNFDSYLVSIVTYNSSSTSDFENFFQSSNYIFRPDIGIIEITQPLPVEWDTFDSLPQFHQHPLYDKIKEKAESLIKIQKHHFGDMINTIKSYIGEPSEYILSPPTNNIAMVIGDSNFFTFDKKYFKFKGNCSYILTAEFLTTTFAVEINYDPERVITISMPHSILKILSNSTVLENDVKANLPIITGSLIVLQENYEIVVDYAKGLKVICNLYYNYCSVQLSGWLFGKVGGLLGTLDNDMSTDFNLPDGNKADDIQHFAESWKVGDCQSSNQLMLENNTTHISPLSITLFETLCQLFFTNVNSPLASCFNIIDTDPFYDICVNDMKDIKNLSLCSSIAAYRARCKYSSIDVEMPEMCIHCNYNIGEKEEILDKTTPKSIDVVIIKEMNCFNNNAYLTYLAKQLDEDFIKTGFKNNRFSIVGYGSDKPYIYFSKNKVWMDPKTLSFDIKILPKIYLNNHKSISQTLDFILSKLEFRPGVSKQFITISCSSTDEDEDINNLRLIFGEKDITMHLMKLNAVKKTSKNTLFAQNKLAVNSSLIEDINAVLKHEKDAIDVITLLALSSEGTAFHVNTKTKLTDNKILNAVSKTISLTAKQSPCQRCKCVSNPDGTGKIDCTRCMSPIVKQLLNEYEANGIVFP
ncbi:hypothetical protein FQR65_LT08250 [Abscondita terminalis]|nr:hypothetical protein FQR65_LT08250 [Abscondita terminalis]